MRRNRLKFESVGVALSLSWLGLLIFGGGAGCGGGGTSGSGSTTTATTGTTTGGTAMDVKLIGVYSGSQSPANLLSLNVGDSIQFEYVGRLSSSSLAYSVVTGSNLSSNVPSNVARFSGKVMSVVGGSGGSQYTVSGAYGSTMLSDSVATNSQSSKSLARVNGLVRDPSGNLVFGAPVTFYAGTNQVATTTTGIDGSFSAELPTSATSFAVNFSGMTYYYNEYSYGSLNYAVTSTGCVTPLPVLVAGSNVNLPNPVVPYVYDINNPPPPPTGCGS